MTNPYLELVARLETEGGKKSIKGPNGEDSNNPYNIKLSAAEREAGVLGYRAVDKAEKSKDPYKVFASREEADKAFMGLMERRYPEALAAMQEPWGPESITKFATGLKKRGYATDPDYVAKLVNVGASIKGDGYVPPAKQVDRRQQEMNAVINSYILRPADDKALRLANARREADNFNQQITAESQPTGLERLGAAMAGNTDSQIFKGVKEMLFGPKYERQAGYVPDATLLPSGADSRLVNDFKLAGSQAEADAILEDYREEQERMKAVMSGGVVSGIALSFAAEVPTLSNLLPSVAAAKVARLAGMANSVQLMAEGRTATAVGAAIAENVASGTVVEAVRQGVTGDYSLADMGIAAAADVAFGLGTSALAAKGAGQALHAAAVRGEVDRYTGLVERAKSELGDSASPEDLRTRADELYKADLENVVKQADTHDVPVERKLLNTAETSVVNGPTGAKLYHGTREAFDTPDYEKGGGLVHYAETPEIAQRYAVAAGGSRKVLEKDDALIFAPDGFVYEHDPVTGDWFSVGKADPEKLPMPDAVLPLSKGDVGDYDGMSTAMVDANREEPGWQRVSKSARIVSRNLPGNVLDATTPEGLRVIAGLSDGGLAIPQSIVNSAKAGTFNTDFWSLTKRAAAPHINKGVAHIVAQLEAAGYKGLRFNDDQHKTVALFKSADSVNAPGNPTAGTTLQSTAKVKESLEAALTSPALTAEISPDSRGARQLVQHLLKTLPPSVLNNDVNFIGQGKRGSYNFVTNAVESPGAGGANLLPTTNFPNEAVILAHEVVHAATSKTIAAVEAGAGGVSKEMVRAVQNLGAIRRDLELELKRLGLRNEDSNFGANYAAKNLHEFVAQVMSDNETRQILAKMPAKGFVDRLSEFADAVMRLLGFNTKNKTALQEAVTLIDKVIKEGPPVEERATLTRVNGPVQSVAAIQTDPDIARLGLSTLPVQTDADRANVKQLLELHKRAEAWAVKNPKDAEYNKRVQNLADNNVFNVASTGLIMLKSESPLVRMIASELLEDASGVQKGRKDTAAIAKHITERAIMKNTINDFQTAYAFWKKDKQGAGLWEDMVGGKHWEEFNKLAASEIEARRVAKGPVSTDANVKAAADSLEAGYTRAATQQRKAKTLGWASLPESSVGYMPHKMSPQKVVNMTNEQQQILHTALTDQFITVEGWDASFSDMLASKYMKRVRDRAYGKYDSVIGGNSQGAADIVQDALIAMNLSPSEIRAHMVNYTKGAANFTKGRVELDLNKVYTTSTGTFRLMDVFETNQIELLRSQAGRVSGEVALAKYGVYGKPGLQMLKDAMRYGEDGKKALDREFDAFDQIAAEFMSEPFGNHTGKFLERAMAANTLVRLGGVAFNQLAETVNGVFHVGAARALESVTSIGRLRSEIKDLAAGKAVDNPIIGSIELVGGAEFGTDAYKFVMPFDSPDHAYPTYGRDTLTLTDRLLRGGNHLQAKLSGWRMIHSAQQRGMAEQVVHKMMRYVREGKDDVALRDFGITEEVQKYLRDNLDKIATFDGNRLVRLEVDKLPESNLRAQLVQAVWRGNAQIIQGTYIGERGKWVHDGLMKVMTQFRGFGLTSMEKQWGRQRNQRGTYAAFGMVIGAMSLAAPIYMARVYASSIGRPDQAEYLEERLTAQNIARATQNYIALSGMAGDFIDLTTALAPDAVKEATGFNPLGSTGKEADLVGNYVLPSASLVNDGFKWLQSPTEVDDLARVLPMSRLPFLVPLMNVAKGE